MSEDRFDAALGDAQQTGDWSAVISLYIGAALAEAKAFNLTHAYIHALEVNDPRAPGLKARLVALGSEIDELT